MLSKIPEGLHLGVPPARGRGKPGNHVADVLVGTLVGRLEQADDVEVFGCRFLCSGVQGLPVLVKQKSEFLVDLGESAQHFVRLGSFFDVRSYLGSFWLTVVSVLPLTLVSVPPARTSS